MRGALLAPTIITEMTNSSIITKVLNLLNSLAEGDEIKSRNKNECILMIFAPHSGHFLEKCTSFQN